VTYVAQRNPALDDGRPSGALHDPSLDAGDVPLLSDLATRHSLAPSIFVASTRNGAVLLDLARNRYFGVGPNEARVLECLDGRSLTSATGACPATSAACQRDMDESSIKLLADMGIILSGRPAREIVSAHVRLDGALTAIGDEITQPVVVRAGHGAAVVKALIVSWYSLRFRPLASTVRSVYKRRSAAIARGYIPDPRKLAELVCIFRCIRPFLFTASGHCMLHALTLAAFLARYGEFPLWVMGVKVDPWAAHSWVQQDGFLLDTNPEKVCKFNPILAV
jgi:hypothetical protein